MKAAFALHLLRDMVGGQVEGRSGASETVALTEKRAQNIAESITPESSFQTPLFAFQDTPETVRSDAEKLCRHLWPMHRAPGNPLLQRWTVSQGVHIVLVSLFSICTCLH